MELQPRVRCASPRCAPDAGVLVEGLPYLDKRLEGDVVRHALRPADRPEEDRVERPQDLDEVCGKAGAY